jgi:hypothetical protein
MSEVSVTWAPPREQTGEAFWAQLTSQTLSPIEALVEIPRIRQQDLCKATNNDRLGELGCEKSLSNILFITDIRRSKI